jgi:hypothetical protein
MEEETSRNSWAIRIGVVINLRYCQTGLEVIYIKPPTRRGIESRKSV